MYVVKQFDRYASKDGHGTIWVSNVTEATQFETEQQACAIAGQVQEGQVIDIRGLWPFDELG
ncbi:MAG: hypothetical protein ACJ74Z_10815 [Bryobacteraceae bacterium]